MRAHRGQATIEIAMVLPVLALGLATVLQVALLARDQIHLTHAGAAAARAVMVDPRPAAAAAALDQAGLDLPDRRVRVTGNLHSGGLATVRVRARPTRVPLVGRLLLGVMLEERLTVRVE